MKVFILTREPYPYGMAAVKRIHTYAKAWQMEGLDVEVIIYTRTERYGQQTCNTQGSGNFEGIPYRYISGRTTRERFVFLRRWNDIKDEYLIKKKLIRELSAGDVIFKYGLDFKLKYLKNLTKSKYIKYIHELCELPFATKDETSKTIKLRKRFENKIMSKVDGVISISDSLTNYSLLHCSSSAKITKIPILVDFPKYDMADRSHEAEFPYIFHSGTLYEQKDGFLSMLEAFGQSLNSIPENAKFISTGNPKGTRHEKEISEIIHKYKLENRVIFTGYLKEDELKDYLAKASFVIINKRITLQNEYCFSTKLGEYMAASKAIVITRVGEAMNWLTHKKDAYIIEPDSITELKNAIISMFKDNNLRKHLGINARETCLTSFSIESNAKALKDALM